MDSFYQQSNMLHLTLIALQIFNNEILECNQFTGNEIMTSASQMILQYKAKNRIYLSSKVHGECLKENGLRKNCSGQDYSRNSLKTDDYS